MNNFLKRTITGTAYVVIMLGAVVFHPILFAIIYGTLLILALSEFYKLSNLFGYHPLKVVGYATGLMFFLICFLVAYNIIPSVYILLFIPFLFFVFISSLFFKNENSLKTSAITITGFVYTGLPFSLMNFIIFNETDGTKIFYPWILAGILFIIWIYDTMAYVSGSLLGKHKIASTISPAKSWEGLVGGTVFAVIVGILNAVLFQEINMMNWIIIALITVIFGTLGDFFESKVKREIGIKDSGSIFPGHGGFLDRFDSLLFAIPIVFVWLTLMDKF